MRKVLMTFLSGVLMGSGTTESMAASEAINFQNFGGSVFNSKGKLADSKLFLKRDGTYVLTIPGKNMRNGDWDSKGTWRMDGNTMCTSQTEPPPPAQASKEFCQVIPVKNYGEPWVVKGQGGDTTVTIDQEETML